MIEALFAGTDPGQHLNPGKIVGTGHGVDAPVSGPAASSRP
jgi:hypothetical protein